MQGFLAFLGAQGVTISVRLSNKKCYFRGQTEPKIFRLVY